MAQSPATAQLISIPKEAAEKLRDKVKVAGLGALRDVLAAFDDGEITAQERDDLASEIAGDLADISGAFLDLVIVLPEPGESISDLAIDQGLQAAEPLLAQGLVKLGTLLGRARDLFDRDLDRLTRRITEATVEGRHKAARRMVRALLKHFPEAVQEVGRAQLQSHPELAHQVGWRRIADGGVTFSPKE